MRILLVVPLTALLIGCGSDSTTTSVTIADFKFGAPLTVAKGAAVTFENTDSAPHNAVGDAFKTADLQKGDRDTVTFGEAGTFDYVCTFHPFMKGSIVVR